MFLSDAQILNAILFAPLMGALALALLPRHRINLARPIAVAFSLFAFLLSLFLAWHFDSSAAAARFQFVCDHSWIPSIGARFTLGLDGLSLLLVVLTAFLGVIAIGSLFLTAGQGARVHFALLLLLETCLLGVFLSLDFVLFYLFWEATLVPTYFLIAGEGDGRRAAAAMKFFLYTLAASMLMLLAIVAIAHSRQTFDMRQILAHPFSLADGWPLQKWAFWGFFFAFAVKVGMFPFHTWLPDAHAEAPVSASLLLAGAALNMGVYGFLRISVPMLPLAASHYRDAILAFSVLTIIYGGFLTLAQSDAKRLVACSSIPQLGFCTLGIFSLTPLGMTGAAILMISQALTVAALFLLFAILAGHQDTISIEGLRGAAKGLPGLAALYLVFTLAALGLPLLSGFVGEFTILQGAFAVGWTWAAYGVFGILLFAAVLLWLYQRVIFPASAPASPPLGRLHPAAWAALLPLAALVLWIGIYPQPIFRVLEPPVKQAIAAVNPGYYVAARAAAPDPPAGHSANSSAGAPLPRVAVPGGK